MGIKEAPRKTTKFICPNNCGSIRWLNAGVNLALCHNPKCDNVMMISASFKPNSRGKEKKTPAPFICDKCGKGRDEGIHSLTVVNKGKYALCYECSKLYVSPESSWKSPSKNSNV